MSYKVSYTLPYTFDSLIKNSSLESPLIVPSIFKRIFKPVKKYAILSLSASILSLVNYEAYASTENNSALITNDNLIANNLQIEEKTVPNAYIQDAITHIILALDAYSSWDMSVVHQELSIALGIIKTNNIMQDSVAFSIVQKELPEAYQGFNLFDIYQDSQKSIKSKTPNNKNVSTPNKPQKNSQKNDGLYENHTQPDYQLYENQSNKTSVVKTSSYQNGNKAPLPKTLKKETEPKDLSLKSLSPGEALKRDENGNPTKYLSDEDMRFVKLEIDRIVSAFGDKSYPHSELFEQQVAYFVKAYQTDLKGFFEKSLIRSFKYMPMVETLLREKGVPDVMAYIAFVESGFRISSLSRPGAAGLWQFMPKTAKDYKLKVDKDFDERFDPEKSTMAAREYFMDLVAIFGSDSFLLAMASYNAGEGKIQYCLKQMPNPFTQRTFWDIGPCLRQETREYIPRIIAAAIVAQAPDRFGFGHILKYKNTDNYQIALVPSETDLKAIAEISAISMDTLRALNPDLGAKDLKTPKLVESYPILIPAGAKTLLDEEFELKLSAKNYKKEDIKETIRNSNETTEVLTLKDQISNNEPEEKVIDEKISASKPQPEDKSYRVDLEAKTKDYHLPWKPERSTIELASIAHNEAIVSSVSKNNNLQKNVKLSENTSFDENAFDYLVTQGDTLFQIALYFDLTIEQIIADNPKLATRGVQSGELLKIKTIHKGWHVYNHTIVKGDTLDQIAQKYNIKVSDLKRWNGISKGNYANRTKLRIYLPIDQDSDIMRRSIKTDQNASTLPEKNSVSENHTLSEKNTLHKVNTKAIPNSPDLPISEILYEVKSGNTLTFVSNIFDVSVSEILKWNDLKEENIQTGQKLVIYPKRKIFVEKYTVKSGDTIPIIAKQFNITTVAMRAINGLSPYDTLKQGQKLKIYTYQE